ncbi:hypothetical protein HNP21_005809 [Bacillus aryabhattai]|uniref:Uncharacterized protein n=1 Tax=Priestia aryabhattai TaxID=412384 RepID=A0A7W3NGX6_PRIAR|nr:hypothetical protein [Priestia aryabhattai]PEZ47128.1 hypothetical protein CN367_11495 [Priestia megaterium]PFL64058.1 hypothetical protein COJ36_21385 [Priestia megaterium]
MGFFVFISMGNFVIRYAIYIISEISQNTSSQATFRGEIKVLFNKELNLVIYEVQKNRRNRWNS